jgi:hypothetical protein
MNGEAKWLPYIDSQGTTRVGLESDIGVLSPDAHALIDHTNQLGVFVPSSFLIAVAESAVTVGNQWTQVTGLGLGPQNYDSDLGPDLVIADTSDAINAVRQGRYRMAINCQLTNPTADGWFEPAIESSAMPALAWPGDVDRMHVGTWIPAAAAAFPEIQLGMDAGLRIDVHVGDQLTGWCRYMTATGTDTIDVTTILYIQRVTS